MNQSPDITRLLQEQADGREGAFDELVEAVFDELCRIARRQMRSQAPGHTLNTGSLVNEAYLHLSSLARAGWQNRGHFFGVAGLAMKQILLQHARAKMAKKRGEGSRPVPLEDVELMSDAQAEHLLAIDDALARLDAQGPRLRTVVEHKIFAGLTVEEIAEATGVSKATVKRDWVFARAWLNRELGSGRVE